MDKNMVLALPELLKKIFYFLAKDDALYPTLLVSRLWSMCAGPILWGLIDPDRFYKIEESNKYLLEKQHAKKFFYHVPGRKLAMIKMFVCFDI